MLRCEHFLSILGIEFSLHAMDPKDVFRRALTLLVQKQLQPTPANYAYAYRLSDGLLEERAKQITQSELVLLAQLLDVLKPAIPPENPIAEHLQQLTALISSGSSLPDQLVQAQALVKALASKPAVQPIKDNIALTEYLKGSVAALYAELQAALLEVQGADDLMPQYEARLAKCSSLEGAMTILSELTSDVKALSRTLKKTTAAMQETQRCLNQANTQLAEATAKAHQSEQYANTDPLTGVLNRRGIDARLASQPAGPIGLILVDIDNFKQINDTLGHGVGDEVICALANILASTDFKNAFAARLGGEELCLLLPGASMTEAENVAKSLMQALAQWNKQEFTPQFQRVVTMSGGISRWYNNGLFADAQFKFALEIADKHLYRAKRAGKNRIFTEADDD